MGIVQPEVIKQIAEQLNNLSPEQIQLLLSMFATAFLSFSSLSKFEIDKIDNRRSHISGNGPHNGWRITYSHIFTHNSSHLDYDNPEGGWTVTYPEHFQQHMQWYEEGMNDGLWRVGLSPDYHLWSATMIYSSMLVKEQKIVQPPPFTSATKAQLWARAELERKFPSLYQKGVKAHPHTIQVERREKQQPLKLSWSAVFKTLLGGVSIE